MMNCIEIDLWLDSEIEVLKPDAKEISRGKNLAETMITNIIKPSLSLYLPEHSSSPSHCAIICAGGAYAMQSIYTEGHFIAQELQKNGIAAAVLKYRLPDSRLFNNQNEVPFKDAQQAIHILRRDFSKYNLDQKQIGYLGFSAGGHIAAMNSNSWQIPLINQRKEQIEPNFIGLLYPLISMQDDLTHRGSQRNLLGRNPSLEIQNKYSNELLCNKNTPKTFITHAFDDNVVKIENSIEYISALKNTNIDVTAHLFNHGGHGFGLGSGHEKAWVKLFTNWLKSNI